MRSVSLVRTGGTYVCVSIGTGKRQTRIYLTEDQAQLLSNRLQSFAKGNFGIERDIVVENEQ